MIKVLKNSQKVYDKVVKHLLTQRERSVGLNSNFVTDCLYHSKDGKMCAAGCLIPKSKYSAGFEGFTWGHLVGAGFVSSNNKDLIRSLQFVHDQCQPDCWKTRLKDVGNKYKLDTKILDEF